jgi:hypothetical protein
VNGAGLYRESASPQAESTLTQDLITIMAPLLEDPRIRQTWNQISQNAETATESAAAGIWSFQHTYINPCFASIESGFEQCMGHCFPDRDERARRIRDRGRTRGRAELSFDFYDDWDEDDGFGNRGALGGWGNDELDRLLAGSGSHSGGNEGVDQAPRRKRGMSYGTRGGRKSLDPDPTVIPNTNALGFLGRLPFKLGGTLRYKPSAADLQDHPGTMRTEFREEEGEPLISDDQSEDERPNGKRHTRNRSSTASSGETSDSFRSRGDLFPSDGEDDAVPLSDEFAMVLERRMTDDRSSAKTRSSKGKRPSGTRAISRNLSRAAQMSPSQSRPAIESHLASSASSLPRTPPPNGLSSDMIEAPSLSDLQAEEEMIREEEEIEVERKREAAARLALERGLHPGTSTEETIIETKPNLPLTDDMPEVISEVVTEADSAVIEAPEHPTMEPTVGKPDSEIDGSSKTLEASEAGFVPARLPYFG